MYRVRRMKLDRSESFDALATIAGELYSRAVVSFWRSVRKDVWLKPVSMMRWHTDSRLHAHSADAVVQQFYGALKSWRKRRKDDPNARPPRRRRRFARLQWKNTAIRLRGDMLVLSNGKLTPPILIPWTFDLPVMVEIGWGGTQYELREVYRTEAISAQRTGGSVAGIDLGEIHVAVAHDGKHTTIVNGRHLRALRRYQNKLKAHLSTIIDRKKRGSRRRRRLARSKARQLRKLASQINGRQPISSQCCISMAFRQLPSATSARSGNARISERKRTKKSISGSLARRAGKSPTRRSSAACRPYCRTSAIVRRPVRNAVA